MLEIIIQPKTANSEKYKSIKPLSMISLRLGGKIGKHNIHHYKRKFALINLIL